MNKFRFEAKEVLCAINKRAGAPYFSKTGAIVNRNTTEWRKRMENVKEIFRFTRKKAKKGLGPQAVIFLPRKERHDIDSFLKFVLDACEGFFYKNDNQIDLVLIARKKKYHFDFVSGDISEKGIDDIVDFIRKKLEAA